MRCSSMNGLCSGGRAAAHIKIISNAPVCPAILRPIPRIRARPMRPRPNMNSQSTMGLPAKL